MRRDVYCGFSLLVINWEAINKDITAPVPRTVSLVFTCPTDAENLNLLSEILRSRALQL